MPASFIFLLLPPQGDDEMLFVGVFMSRIFCCCWHLCARQMQENVGQMPQLPASVQPEGEEDRRAERAPLGMRGPARPRAVVAASVPGRGTATRPGLAAGCAERPQPRIRENSRYDQAGRQGGRRQGAALSPRRGAPAGRVGGGLQHRPWLDSVGSFRLPASGFCRPASGVPRPGSGLVRPGPLVPPGAGRS